MAAHPSCRIAGVNPYQEALGGRDPPRCHGRDAVDGRPTWCGRRGSELWPIPRHREVDGRPGLTHLAQTEMVFATRVRFALTKANTSSSRTIRTCGCRSRPGPMARAALDTWLALRRFNLPLFVEGTAAALDRPLVHPERGRMTVRVLLETIAGHDLHHLSQLKSVFGDGIRGNERTFICARRRGTIRGRTRNRYGKMTLGYVSMTSLAGTRIDNFRIVEKLGDGGMGEVYRAVDEMLERDVALEVSPSRTGQPGGARRAIPHRGRRARAPAPSRTSPPSMAFSATARRSSWSWSTCRARRSST